MAEVSKTSNIYIHNVCVCCFYVHIHTMPLNSNMPSASKAFSTLVEEWTPDRVVLLYVPYKQNQC